MPGEYFFYGIDEPIQHAKDIRITYSQPESIIEEGINILAEEVKSIRELIPIQILERIV